MIQRAKMAGRLSPEAVQGLASLIMADDSGIYLSPAPHHDLWLRLMCDERIKMLLIIAPPESAKTTWMLAFLGCYVGFYPERSVIIGSVSGPVAEKRSMSLRTMVESPTWQVVFEDVKPVKSSAGLKWESGEWSLAPDGIPHPGRLHPTLAAYGTGGSVIGARADLVVGDDLLDLDNSRTHHQRELVETWLHSSFLSRRKAQTGRAILIGTAWHYDDIYSKARKSGDWVICHLPLLSESEGVTATIVYPDNFPMEARIGRPAAAAVL